MVFLWNILNAGFWKNVKAGHAGEKIELDLPLMTEGLFGAGSAMIAFGVVIGKASPAQMFFLSFWQVCATERAMVALCCVHAWLFWPARLTTKRCRLFFTRSISTSTS